MKTTLLIDADICCFQAAASNERVFDWGDGDFTFGLNEDSAKERIDKTIAEYMDRLDATDYICCLTAKDNWRNDVLPTYKMNRSGKKRPELLGMCRQYLRDNHPHKEVPRLEGDDVMGIYATHPTLITGHKIMVSMDKDMKTIPGYVWNPNKPEQGVFHSTVEDAHRFHMYQTLQGDQVDGYAGCPSIGKKKAERIIYESNTEPKDLWNLVVSVYESKGLTEDDALTQARVARICQFTEFNYQTKEVILWNPK